MMNNLFWLTDAQMEWQWLFFPKSHGNVHPPTLERLEELLEEEATYRNAVVIGRKAVSHT
jgi:hypothetical protein